MVGIWEWEVIEWENIMIFTLFTMCVFVAQSCPTLCNCTVCSPVHGILQARILEWIAIPFSRGTFQPSDQTLVFCITGRFFTVWATGKSPKKKKKYEALAPEQGHEPWTLRLKVWCSNDWTIQAMYTLLHPPSLLVAQSCLTLCNPMDCSPLGSSVHGNSRQEQWSGLPLSSPKICLTQGLNLGIPHCRQISLLSETPGKPNKFLFSQV